MGYNILVVDDISFNRTVLKSALRDMEDVTFYEASNGEQALDMLVEHEISLLVLDLMMPGKNGFDVLRDMRSTASFRDIPVIVYSAIDEIDSISEALELGAYDYFTKPLKPKQMNVILPLKVRNALKNYEQQKTIQGLNEKIKVEMLMANVLQQSLLHEEQDMPDGIMYGKYVPCHEIGGDFYDCAQLGENLWFIMADVSGYGVPAAMLSSMLKVEFHHCIRSLESPDAVMRYINNTFCQFTQGNYCLTAFVGLIRHKELWYSNAGQPYPFLWSSATESMRILRESSFTLGMVEDEVFGLNHCSLQTGDIILSYTDGLLEDKVIHGSQGVYEDLANCFKSYRHIIQESPAQFFEIMFRLFGNSVTKSVKNDMAMMLICLK